MQSKIRFPIDFFSYALKGGAQYYAWLGFLGILIVLWAVGTYAQLTQGMIITGLTDQTSWGLYLANFVFLVGVAAAAVTVVFPAYFYDQEDLHKVAVLGEMLAIAAVVMCLLFVFAHMGRPDRLWHIIPVIGIYNWPHSMLTWDVMVLTVYLILNLVGGFYYLYKKYTGSPLNKSFYIPLILISCVWALSIHTVTAFLIGTMPSRPMWFHSVMPIKFITTAFAAGPALIILCFLTIRKHTALVIPDSVFHKLSHYITWFLGMALFLIMSEIVVELYPSTEHSFGLQYLMFGLSGLNKLVPWFWTAIFLMVVSFGLLLSPLRKNFTVLPIICVMLFVGIWIDKGMGLLLPGMSPSPIGEVTEYYPTWLEIFVVAGNYAIGFLVLTLLMKGAVGVVLGDVKYGQSK
ncbi:sulfate reduction electron transfer complex DsrMKJOP subunit DsrP [Pseudomonadota bacterium]